MTKTKDRILNIPYKQTTEHCPRAVMSEIENILVIWETSVSHKLFTLRQSPQRDDLLCLTISSICLSSLYPLHTNLLGETSFFPLPIMGVSWFMPMFFLMLSNSWPKDHYYETLLKVVVIIKKKKLQDSKHFSWLT